MKYALFLHLFWVMAAASPCSEALKSKSILVTGATGFVGRNLALRLLQEDRYGRVIFVVRDPQKLEAQLKAEGFDSLPENVTVVKAKAPELDLGGTQADHVVHTVGVIDGKDRAEYEMVNVDGTLSVLDQVRDSEKIIILSSMAAGGPIPPGKTHRTETDPREPVTWYGESKAKMEEEIEKREAHPGLWVLRPPMILGARDQASLPLFQMAGGPLRFKVGRNPKPLSYIAVNDLIHAMDLILTGDARPELPYYFVSSPHTITDAELILSAGALMGRTKDIFQAVNPLFGGSGQILGLREKMVMRLSALVERSPQLRQKIPNLSAGRVGELLADGWVISSKQLENTLGWQATTELMPVLEETRFWYQQNGQLRPPRR